MLDTMWSLSQMQNCCCWLLKLSWSNLAVAFCGGPSCLLDALMKPLSLTTGVCYIMNLLHSSAARIPKDNLLILRFMVPTLNTIRFEETCSSISKMLKLIWASNNAQLTVILTVQHQINQTPCKDQAVKDFMTNFKVYDTKDLITY